MTLKDVTQPLRLWFPSSVNTLFYLRWRGIHQGIEIMENKLIQCPSTGMMMKLLKASTGRGKTSQFLFQNSSAEKNQEIRVHSCRRRTFAFRRQKRHQSASCRQQGMNRESLSGSARDSSTAQMPDTQPTSPDLRLLTSSPRRLPLLHTSPRSCISG